jgi:8-oxo-dGTP pyrophosphatase MutT (NUDIX family)
VHVVAIDDDDNLILVEQYRHGLGKASLELPAGAIDPTDSGPLEAAARELKEETGYVAQLLSETLVMSPNPATHNNRFHVVLARGVTRRHAPLQDPTERLNVIRVPIREVVRRLVRGDMLHSMHVASLAVALTSIGRWER